MLNKVQDRRDCVIILLGRMVSTFGDGIALIALTLRLQAEGAPPYEVALLLSAGAAPMLLVVGRVGRLVDSHDSRRLLVVAGLVEVAATVPLIFVHSIWLIVALVAVLGPAASVSSATWSALLPRVTGEDGLAGAMSAQQSLAALALVGAPAAGGLLAGGLGSGVAVAVDAASFVVITLAAGVIRTRRSPERLSAADDGTERAAGGFAPLRADRPRAPLLAGVSVVVALVGMVDVVLVYLVRDTLHASGVWYGVAEASWMAGMVLGAVSSGAVETERARVRCTVAGAAVACAALAAFAIAPAVVVLVPLAILGGLGNGVAGTCLSTLLLARTPDAARGRVSAAANAALGGSQATSLLAGGVLAGFLSPRSVYAVAGLLGLAASGALALAITAAGHSPARAVHPPVDSGGPYVASDPGEYPVLITPAAPGDL
jgi:MFS family permease